MSNKASRMARPGNSKRAIKYPIGTATHSESSVVSVQLKRLNRMAYRISGEPKACHRCPGVV